MPGASIRNSTTGCVPRSGWAMKVSIAPSLVAMSRILSIMALLPLCRHATTLLGSTQPKSLWERNDDAWCVGCGWGRVVGPCGNECACLGAGLERHGEDWRRYGHVEPLLRHQRSRCRGRHADGDRRF